jgi:hypothetical protein
MNHKIVSFYHKNLNPEIKLIQKKIFDKLGIELTQVEFSGSHGSAINDFLNNNSWDIVTLFDVDSFPLKKEVISEVLSNIDDFTIYGNAQVSNSEPYAAPSFITFTKNLYESSIHKNFDGSMYSDDGKNFYEADCGEIFVKENIKRGVKLILKYPTKNEIDMEWGFKGNEKFKKFKYGIGTTFESDVYHCFQIRFPEIQGHFIKFAEDFLNKKI